MCIATLLVSYEYLITIEGVASRIQSHLWSYGEHITILTCIKNYMLYGWSCVFIVITKSIHWNQKNSGWRNCIEFRNSSDPLTKKKSFLLEFNQTWYKANVTIKQIRILNVRCCNVPNVVKSAQLKAVPTEQNIKHTG